MNEREYVCLCLTVCVSLFLRASWFVCACALAFLCVGVFSRFVLQSIVINLNFDSEETRQLGVDRHVCELQLLTCCFAAILQVPVHDTHFP